MQEQIGMASYLSLALARLPVHDGAAGVQNSSHEANIEPVFDFLDMDRLVTQAPGYKILSPSHQFRPLSWISIFVHKYIII